MPGIVGIISDRPATECQLRVSAMLASMKHDPCYVCGTRSVSEFGVYAGWVAHEGSFSANQPFSNETGDIVLLFAGECFIDPDARRTLARRGHNLADNAADWMVHLYEEEGARFFESLNGLFSGLLIDKRQKKVFLFNDRYGVERIYWYEDEGEFYFASEAKALLRILPELREFDENGVAQFLSYGCTLGTRTLFREINTLPGGSVWSLKDGKYRQKYFSPYTWESQPTLSEEAFESAFEETFKRVLPRYFETERKIGISLTGGLDSRLIMACLPNIKAMPECYTFSGQNQDVLDARLAAQVAKTCGLRHRILRIGEDFFSNFDSYVDRTIYITDGYLGPLGAHEIYLNGHARSSAPVRLTGVFGDEILRGRSFKSLPVSTRIIRPDLAKAISALPQDLRNSQHPRTFAAFNEISGKRFGIPAAARSQLTFRTPYLDNDVVALAYRVPGSLQSSARPVLSAIKRNNPELGAIPTDMGCILETNRLASVARRIFSRAAFKLDYFYNEGLPHWLSRLDPLFRQVNSGLGIVGRHKFLHYRSWFQQELAPYLKAVLRDTELRGSRFFNSDFIGEMAREHTCGRKNYVLEIDAVITFEAVERLLFRGHPHATAGVATRASVAAVSSSCTPEAASALQ
jgi:asparagine synthase (glutamine-hydrolysing)